MYMNILAEKPFSLSHWFDEIVEGLKLAVSRRSIELNIIGDISETENFPEKFGKLCIVIGGSEAWLKNVANVLNMRGFRMIFVGAGNMQGGITLDYARSCQSAIKYMQNSGCRSLAFCGFNADAYSDRLKCEAFLNTCGGEVFSNSGDAEACCLRAAENIEKYDGIVCANDYITIMLVRMLKCRKITHLPLIASFGNTAAIDLVYPEIIKIQLDFKAAGQKAADAYIYLSKKSDVLCTSMTVKSNLIVRGKVVAADAEPIAEGHGTEKRVYFYDDPAIKEILRLEHLLCSMDELDKGLFDLLSSGKTYEQTAELMNTSVATVKYRIRRLTGLCGFEDKNEALTLYGKFNSSKANEV